MYFFINIRRYADTILPNLVNFLTEIEQLKEFIANFAPLNGKRTSNNSHIPNPNTDYTD